MDNTESQYRSGESRTDWFVGIGCLIYVAAIVFTGPDKRWAAVAFLILAIYRIRQGLRNSRRPYIQLSANHLVVFERGQSKQDIDLSTIAAVEHRFNRTVLVTREGMKISI